MVESSGRNPADHVGHQLWKRYLQRRRDPDIYTSSWPVSQRERWISENGFQWLHPATPGKPFQ